jgi:hypothetical protein
MHDMSDLRKSIAERLGIAAKFTMSAAKYRAFVYRGSPRSNVLVKATEWMDSAIAAEEAAKQIAMSFRGQPGYNSDNYFADIAQETPMGAKTVKNNVRFSRPGAKAKFGNVDRLDSLIAAVYRALRNNDKEAAKRLMADAAKEIDSSTPAYIVSEYKDLKRSMSRPGAKAKFMTNAGFAFLQKMLREYASMKGTRWYNEAEEIRDNSTEYTDADVIAAVGNLKIAKSVSSRPGAKAKMATEVGRKGNKAAMISRDPNGGWRAWVVQRGSTGIDQYEDLIGTMRSYATEEKAKRAVIAALDTSGFSRPGAKAKMAKRYDATMVGDELVRSDGRRYQITGRKPSLPKTRELQGELEWVMMVGSNGAKYNVQRFEDGGYRVFGGSMGMTVQWEGLLRASRPGAKAVMRQTLQAMHDGLQWKVVIPSGAAWYSDDGKQWTKKHGEPVPSSEVKQYEIKLGTGFARPGAKGSSKAKA